MTFMITDIITDPNNQFVIENSSFKLIIRGEEVAKNCDLVTLGFELSQITGFGMCSSQKLRLE